MKKQATYQGPRSVPKSTGVTPKTKRMLARLFEEYRISLADIVEDATLEKYTDKFGELPEGG